MSTDTSEDNSHQRGTLHRSFLVMRALAAHQTEGVRVTHLAKEIGLTQATTHRLLQGLIQEGMVEQDQVHQLYRLSLDLFSLA
ncbi:MAG: helix-turn-helix domain-containing protein, partial [Comamonas sp.]|nr:helix-turn-helix domain-containing protein [Comamonas sp.]